MDVTKMAGTQNLPRPPPEAANVSVATLRSVVSQPPSVITVVDNSGIEVHEIYFERLNNRRINSLAIVLRRVSQLLQA